MPNKLMNWVYLFLITLFSLTVYAQSTVTATITDPDSQTWSSLNGYNATYSIELVSSSGQPVPAGQAFVSSTGATVTNPSPGNLSSSGALSVSLYPNSQITPSGTQWQFHYCPAVSSPVCATTTLTISSSGSISTQLSAATTAPRLGGGQGSFAYADVEVASTPNNTYYNITTPACRYYGSSWTVCGTGSGGGGTVTSFSAGNLTPLFTTSVATATSTPALTFSLTSAAQNSVLAGPATGGAGAPTYQTAPTISAANMTNFPTFNQSTTGTAANLTGCTPSTAGSVCYWNGTVWTLLAGNTTTTNYLQETSAGVPSWASPAGTGTVTSVSGTTNQIDVATGTTTPVISFDANALSNLGGAPLASPTFTGIPAAPTAAVGTSTTQVATTAFVAAAATGCTSGCSYVLTQGDAPTGASLGAGTVLTTAEQPLVTQFYNALSRKLGNACIDIGAASSGGHADVGVYNSSGSLVWHTGSFSTTSTGVLCFTPTAATLTPGTYYTAICADNTTAKIDGINSTGGQNNIMGSGPAHTAGSDTAVGDECTTGVLASSITLTNIVNSTSVNQVPYVYASN